MPDTDEIVERLLERHGRTFADEMGIRLDGGPESLFQLLVGALLMSARIGSDIAMSAARALFSHGYTTPQAMLDASWQDRVDALGEGSYVRYDESTASYLADTSEHLLEAYGGDLRQLREEASGDPDAIRAGLKACKGIGDVGANIFLREIQGIWDELRPFADDAALEPARRLGLGDDADDLDDHVRGEELPRLVAALVRAGLADDIDALLEGDTGGLTGTQLATATKAELYEHARDRGVEGRSDMTKDELVEALSDDD